MTSASLVRGWCPDLFAPMAAQDGLLVRIRPPLGRLTAAQLHVVAEMAESGGNGVIELTNRANLQLRGFSPSSVRTAREMAVKSGLTLADEAAERRSALIVSPLAGLDPECAADTLVCAQALRKTVSEAADFAALPGKFGFAVDGGGYFPTGLLAGDIVLRARNDGWAVCCGHATAEPASVTDAVGAAVRVARMALRHPDRARPARIPETGLSLLEEAGLVACPLRAEAIRRPPVVGRLPEGALGLAVPFGRMNVAALRTLADHLARCDDAVLRLTPWRSVVLAVPSLPDGTMLIDDPADPRLRVQACIGSAGCARALADVAQDALALAMDVPRGRTLHVSGCPKGCAHPDRADVTLCAQSGGYDVIPDGRAGDMPWRSGVGRKEIVALLRRLWKERPDVTGERRDA
ncbi:precorrin-3B synthase [Acetobacter estunensis]|uniref:Precorrin-3B synthase n=1 Tax=Acetobacter estunensis TaxID=104097 RepID=A0A967BB33_9PROT|nr:precorrin-3B synthase [Acetobacter estunensis]NHO53778.1 precorrin-3B synthase [Acetobacter estunensis]